MFCRITRIPSHQLGLAERFRRRTLLFFAFVFGRIIPQMGNIVNLFPLLLFVLLWTLPAQKSRLRQAVPELD